MDWLTGLIGLPMIASPIVYMVGHQRAHPPTVIRVRWLTLALLALMWIALGATAASMDADNTFAVSIGAIALRIDGVGLLMSVLILTLATCIVTFSGEDIDDEQGEEKYYATTLILTGSMIGLVCAADLFNLWVWFEATAFSSYLLVAFYREWRDALGACVKYFIQTISGSVLALFAIALILAQSDIYG